MNSESINKSINREEIIAKIKKLKGIYNAFDKDSSKLSETDSKLKKEVYQELLENEYILQEHRKKLGEIVVKKGDWTIAKTSYGFRRIKVEHDDFCGWA